MTPHQTALVQASFATLAPRAEEVAVLFYQRLFALDPGLRQLFPAEMAALAAAVQALARPEAVIPALQALGRRHAGYGVEDHHYDTVGAALMATLRDGLAEAFDAETEAAWAACYPLVATTMRGAVRAELVPAAA
jgi:hemoglobin-like flavoprotein